MMNKADNLYIGLMSGTSADGIDLALVQFTETGHQLKASYYQPYDAKLRQQIQQLYTPGFNEIDLLGQLDKQLAHHFAAAINSFLMQHNLAPEQICAIGNHGQTVRHRPEFNSPFTLQIGCNQTLACLTGIRVVGKFRDKDIALGGQGAPLVPAYHQAMFAGSEHDVIVVNIGGISNITYLPADTNKNVVGFDTGPGNALLDDWYIKHHANAEYMMDLDGRWASDGVTNNALLTTMLADPYFHKPYPKSSGREYFHLDWLDQQLTEQTLSPADVQATLLSLTVESIGFAIDKLTLQSQVIICGGGAHNSEMMRQLEQRLYRHNVTRADKLGIPSDSLEALVFAWLAYAFDQRIPSNLPSVTGAQKAVPLGINFTP
ncbi:anhydro-N-acetylmuramic acid kinase [Thalassotalea maritima]|uniref:anhydro-N-acetylmuramic acid kinase n=1 Tax=Thalassotalea maritima TaxID=3242416 RepID=UPI00352878FD